VARASRNHYRAALSSQLRPGTYQLTATYNGSDVYDHSTSASHKLTVAN
jgi:hypothetical protein